LKGYAGSPDEPSQKSSGDSTFWDMTCRATGMASLGFRVCRLSVSALSTDATGSGSSPAAAMWATPREAEHKGCGPTGGPSHLHRLERGYLDAEAQAHVGLWATPRSSPNENRTTRNAPSHGVTHGECLSGQAAEFSPTGARPCSKPEPMAPRGQLNPDFVCWLMGYPAGHLNYADSETPSSRKSRRKSSPPSSPPIEP
jgi:hypothetical protein